MAFMSSRTRSPAIMLYVAFRFEMGLRQSAQVVCGRIHDVLHDERHLVLSGRQFNASHGGRNPADRGLLDQQTRSWCSTGSEKS